MIRECSRGMLYVRLLDKTTTSFELSFFGLVDIAKSYVLEWTTDEQHPCHGLYVGSSWAASTHAHATCEADPSLLRSRPSSHAKACGSTRQNLSSTRHCKAIKSAAEAKARSAAEDLSAAGAATALLIIEPGIPRPQIEGDQRHSPILFNPDSKDSPRKEYRSVGWQKTISQPHLRGKLGIGTLLSEYIPTASRIHNAEQQLGQWGRRGIPAAEKDRWSFLSPRAMKQKSIPDACEQSLTVCATAVKGADPHGLDGGVGKSTKNIYIARAPGTHIAQFPEGQRQGLDAENEDFETTTSQNTTDSNKVSADIDTGNEAPRARVVVETPRSPSSCHTPRTTRVTSKRAGDIGGVASAQSIGEGRPQSNAIESFRSVLVAIRVAFQMLYAFSDIRYGPDCWLAWARLLKTNIDARLVTIQHHASVLFSALH